MRLVKPDLTQILCFPECADKFVNDNAPDQKNFEICHLLENLDAFKWNRDLRISGKLKKDNSMPIRMLRKFNVNGMR